MIWPDAAPCTSFSGLSVSAWLDGLIKAAEAREPGIAATANSAIMTATIARKLKVRVVLITFIRVISLFLRLYCLLIDRQRSSPTQTTASWLVSRCSRLFCLFCAAHLNQRN